MSRLTGSDALELMEAYQEVYKPKELSVDEVWEEVENWVNSLLEEGYDLSEYTWEDMYESYLNEGGTGTGARVSNIPTTIRNSPYTLERLGPANYAAYKSAGGDAAMSLGYGTVQDLIQKGRGILDRTSGNLGRNTTPPPNTTPPAPRPRPTVPATGGSGGRVTVGTRYPATQGGVQGSVTYNAQGQRTFTPNRPSGVSTSRPTVPATATTSATPTATATPTRSSVQSGIEDLRRMGAASLMRQQGRTMPDGSIPTGSSLEPRPAVASAPVPSAPVATVRPVPTTQTRRTSAPTRAPILLQRQSFDPFDVIMGHLLDEGYAETLEAAEAIMANMSEEWIQDIVEVTGGGHISMDDTKYTDKLSPAQKRFHQFGPKSTKLVPGSREQHPRRNSWGGSRSPAGTESGLSMTPRERATLAAKRAERKGQGKRASKIRRIINPPTDWSGN